MAFETTYEAFRARLIRQYGEEQGRQMAVEHGRTIAAQYRMYAQAGDLPDAPDPETLRRLADQMDPDLRQEDN